MLGERQHASNSKGLGGYTPVGIPQQVALCDMDTGCCQTLFAGFTHLSQAFGVLQVNHMLLHVPAVACL